MTLSPHHTNVRWLMRRRTVVQGYFILRRTFNIRPHQAWAFALRDGTDSERRTP